MPDFYRVSNVKNNNQLNDYYKDFFISHNIQYIDSVEDFNKIHGNLLFVTSCSKTKSGKQKATPKEFYVSKRNISFYKICEDLGLTYAIQSDLYGLHFYDEELEWYDIHPSVLTKKDKEVLGKIIAKKSADRNIDVIIFCNPSPLQSRPYLEMLSYSGINYYFVSDMNIVKGYYIGKENCKKNH